MMMLISRRSSVFRPSWLYLSAFAGLAILALFMVAGTVTAAQPAAISLPRQMISLSGDAWQFVGAASGDTLPAIDTPDYKAAAWSNVSVPHDFQVRGDLHLGEGWYRRQVAVSPALMHKELYLVFEGAAAIADVYVNGHALGEHRGAYTRFIFDATPYLHVGSDNELAVLVDNRRESTTDCLPNKAGLYAIWGGLYRNVWLLATNAVQVDPTHYASPGVFITPTVVSPTLGNVDVRVWLRNSGASNKTASVKATLVDPQGNTVGVLRGNAPLASATATSVDMSGNVDSLKLWAPGAPELYHVRVDVYDAGKLSDSVTQAFGFRTIVWDFQASTLQVNGKPLTLYGCDLHQEIESKQSAVNAADLTANIDTLQDLGANFVRLAHYPRAQLEYDLCDQRGIFCWAENGHSQNDLATPTADQITTEMVEQNYNHPSIIVWSVGNEGNAEPAEREVPVVKALDSTRAVVVANMKCANADYHTANTYPGWYSGERWNFKPHGLISEVGAGGAVTSHTDYATASHIVNTFEPEEYQQLVAETSFELAFNHNDGKLAMYTWWILRDFNDNKFKSSIAPYRNGINTKGLETYAGDKKDVYYLYRCFLRPTTPTIHITSKRYFIREGAVDNGIKVYSNAPKVTLTLNGSIVSIQMNGDYKQVDPLNTKTDGTIHNVFYWPVPLLTGRNTVVASDEAGNSDSATIYYYPGNDAPDSPDAKSPISDLASSNPANAAHFMDMPVQAQWPIYDDFDSDADNSLDTLPAPVVGASWLALRRVTKTGQATDVSFTAAHPLTVYVIATKNLGVVAPSTFAEVATAPFKWRGNDMLLVDAQLYARHVAAGQKVTLSLGDRDGLVLIKAD